MKKKNKTTLGQSFINMFKNLFSSDRNNFDPDAILSPSQQVKQNFFENKLGIIGLVSFITIFVIVFGSTTFGKGYDQYAHDPVLQNLSPGKNYLKIDKNFKNPVKIESGISFSVGLDEDGNVYQWGKDPAYNAVVSDIVELTEGKNIVDISSGERHVLALTNTGEIIGAGLDNFNQASFPSEIKQRLVGDNIAKIGAASGYSLVLTEQGNVYVWGSTNANELNFIPNSFQGRIKDFSTANFNLVFLLDDGTIGAAGIRGSEINSSMPEELMDGSVNVTQVVASENSAMALDDNNNLYAWGNMAGSSLSALPEIDGTIKKITATDKSYNILTDDGDIHTIGTGQFDLTEVPTSVADKKTKDIFSSYFSVYTIDESNEIDTWGLKGFSLGTDRLGRDVTERLLYGGRISLTVGAVSIVISLVLGVSVGLIAGFYGGIVDNIAMRFAEVVSAFPFMPLAITLSALTPADVSQNTRLAIIMVILGIISWPGVARFVRGQILAEREKDFVLAARALGLRESTIIMKHILPSVFSLIIVNMTLGYASSLLTEAGLSYLGFGVKAPSPSWGNMLNGVVNSVVIERFWWQWLFPAGAVLLAALSVNLIGDALRDAMDPRANQK